MSSWLIRRRLPAESPRLALRAERAPAVRVDVHDVMPELLPYLGQAAYLQLEQFQTLSRVAHAVSLTQKEAIASAAGLALSKHQSIAAEIRRRGAQPAEAMRPFALEVEGFHALLSRADWQETLLAAVMTGGLLDDFFIRFAVGLPGDIGPRVAQLIGSDSGQTALLDILREEIERDAQLASRLAMWGRSLVGDTLLVARSALRISGDRSTDDERVEPIFTELIAAHTRRMDALGLTA